MALKSRKTLWNSINHTVATATKTYKLEWFIHTEGTSEKNKFNPTAGDDIVCPIRKLYPFQPDDRSPGLNVRWGSVEVEGGRQPLHFLLSHSHQRSRFILGLCRALGSSQKLSVPRDPVTPGVILSIIPWIIVMPPARCVPCFLMLYFGLQWVICIHGYKSVIALPSKWGTRGFRYA